MSRSMNFSNSTLSSCRLDRRQLHRQWPVFPRQSDSNHPLVRPSPPPPFETIHRLAQAMNSASTGSRMPLSTRRSHSNVIYAYAVVQPTTKTCEQRDSDGPHNALTFHSHWPLAAPRHWAASMPERTAAPRQIIGQRAILLRDQRGSPA
jgi:hypothetical protein